MARLNLYPLATHGSQVLHDSQVGRLCGLPQVTDLELSPDSGTLYAANLVVADPGTGRSPSTASATWNRCAPAPVADTPYGVGIAPDGTVAATVDDFEETGDTCVFTNGPDQPASVGNLRHNGVWNRHGAAGRRHGDARTLRPRRPVQGQTARRALNPTVTPAPGAC
ncbi:MULTISPECIES: hypothetical protein [Streptomyces]|uniref:hypothetical protein n=1 Tax=Streptomyces TaxID=1883 RepID=UPI0029A3F01A|nr:hypothetical protein [Streptomyces sp. AK02-04a]MDX3761649.1 hypothetical protein [Streptomyces sp. AK02-04a]